MVIINTSGLPPAGGGGDWVVSSDTLDTFFDVRVYTGVSDPRKELIIKKEFILETFYCTSGRDIQYYHVMHFYPTSIVLDNYTSTINTSPRFTRQEFVAIQYSSSTAAIGRDDLDVYFEDNGNININLSMIIRTIGSSGTTTYRAFQKANGSVTYNNIVVTEGIHTNILSANTIYYRIKVKG